MKKNYLTLCAIAGTLVLATLGAMAQDATHPSEDYPGKGGSQDTTNGAPKSPEAQNPATGQQQTGSSSHSTSSSTHNQ